MHRNKPRSKSRRSKSPHKTKSQTWLILSDVHYPAYSRSTFTAALDFASHNEIAGIVLLGDQLDNAEISHHNAAKPLFKPTGAYAKNTKGFDRDILRPLEAVLPPSATKVWIIGNHCDWENQLVEAMPELKGTVERPILLNLRKRGWTVIPLGESFKKGRLSYIHGESLGGMHHAKKAVETFCSNIVYGHFHTLQTFIKTLPHDATQKWIATCLPIVGITNPGYVKNKANSWVNGFGIVEYFDGGSFDLFTVIVSRGKCAYGGRVYGASHRRRGI